jgi:hypothetical protein
MPFSGILGISGPATVIPSKIYLSPPPAEVGGNFSGEILNISEYTAIIRPISPAGLIKSVQNFVNETELPTLQSENLPNEG